MFPKTTYLSAASPSNDTNTFTCADIEAQVVEDCWSSLLVEREDDPQ
jgi:hypothetical protein